MACAASQSILSASSCVFPPQRIHRWSQRVKGNSRLFTVNASSSSEESDCNAEQCAPDKEVGKVSMEWLAGEKTKVVGTYPPQKRGWTGYVEKDTAGQTNIYSVEPTVYVAESAISSGSAGTSAEGSQNTIAIAAGVSLVAIAAASLILTQVSKNPAQVQTTEYSGPPLSYYITKFKPASTVEASVPPQSQSSTVDASIPSKSQSSLTVEAAVPSEPQIPTDVQLKSKALVAPEIQVELMEPAEVQGSSGSNIS